MKKPKYNKIVTTSLLLFLLCYTIYNTYMFYTIGAEPTALTTCVYGFCGVEGGLLAWLKVAERKQDSGKGEADV